MSLSQYCRSEESPTEPRHDSSHMDDVLCYSDSLPLKDRALQIRRRKALIKCAKVEQSLTTFAVGDQQSSNTTGGSSSSISSSSSSSLVANYERGFPETTQCESSSFNECDVHRIGGFDFIEARDEKRWCVSLGAKRLEELKLTRALRRAKKLRDTRMMRTELKHSKKRKRNLNQGVLLDDESTPMTRGALRFDALHIRKCLRRACTRDERLQIYSSAANRESASLSQLLSTCALPWCRKPVHISNTVHCLKHRYVYEAQARKLRTEKRRYEAVEELVADLGGSEMALHRSLRATHNAITLALNAKICHSQ